MMDISAFQSVFQLAVGMNLVLSAYSETRTSLENETEDRVSAAKEKLADVIAARRRELAANPSNKKAAKKLETAEALSDKISIFNKDYYNKRNSMRKIDRILTIILVCTAIAAITSLFYSSIFAQRCRLPTIALLAWSIPLYIPPLVAIVRALYTRNRLYWDFRRRATYIAAHASRFYNNDMRRTQNSTANES